MVRQGVNYDPIRWTRSSHGIVLII